MNSPDKSTHKALDNANPSEMKREDRPGHLDPAHAARLLAKSKEGRTNGDRAFLMGHKSKDPLAEELAEDAVAAMTSGQDALADDLAAEVTEESGGPFVPSTGSVEFAGGHDASNPKNADREPFPRT